jgi:hypothetical protein
MLALGRQPGADEARAAIAGRTRDFANALFAEAADSDDVTGPQAALDYLEGRLLEFGDLLEPATAEVVRTVFRERLVAWAI